jgi:hypothetical protein
MSNTPTSRSHTRRAALAGGAAFVLTAAAVSSVAAQQAAPAPGKDVFVFATSSGPVDLQKRRDDWLSSVAGKLGVDETKLQQAMDDASKEAGVPPFLAAPTIVGQPAFAVSVASPFASAAKALGISEEQLRTEQAGGKSLADIARGHSVDPKVVADALKTQRKTEIDKAVSDGVMPRDTADRIKSHVDDEIDHLMQAVPTVGTASDNGNVNLRFEWSSQSKP